MRLSEVVSPAGATPPDDPARFVVSYRTLRRCIGIVGLALPLVLLASHVLGLVPGALPGSMSAFYYTRMGPYFVGTLCALGVFLFSYRYAPRDNWLSNIASFFVIFVDRRPTPAPRTPRSPVRSN